jgi:hypothetical protein
MQAQQWVSDFNEAARTYSRERRESPVVKVTLTDGGSWYVQKIAAGPNDRLITLDLYPDANDVLANMVSVERHDEGGGTDYFTRDVVVVEPDRVVKVELLYERPQGREVGFVVPTV